MTAEYLRRNLIHAKSVGACSALALCLDRLSKMKRPPQWLVRHINDAHVRAVTIPAEMQRWRDAAPDAPPGTPSPGPRFAETFCSQCGKGFGPGDSGYSHCSDHAGGQSNG